MERRKAYPSDLTDAEWKLLEPLIPAISETAAHVIYTRREIVNGRLYVLRSGCPWRLVPHDLPAWGTLYWYFRMWRKVTAADLSDLQGTQLLLEPLKPVLVEMKVLWGDSHYGGTLVQWAKEHLEWSVQVVRGLITTRGSKQTSEGKEQTEQKLSGTGFQVQPRRWVVERSFAWITRWRRLCRDHEGLPESSEAFIMLSARRRMLSLLVPPFP